MPAKLVDYWTDELKRVKGARAAAGAELAAVAQREIDARKAIEQAGKDAQAAQAKVDKNRAALAQIPMPGDADPLLNDMRDAFASFRAAQAAQVSGDAALRAAQADRAAVQGRLDGLAAEQAAVTATLETAKTAHKARTDLAARLRAAPVKDLRATAGAANATATAALAKVKADFPKNAAPAKDFLTSVAARRKVLNDQISLAGGLLDEARKVQRAWVESTKRKVDLIPALASEHAAAVAELERVGELKPRVDAAIALLATVKDHQGRFISDGEFNALTKDDKTDRETALALLNTLAEKEGDLVTARKAHEEALAPAKVASPGKTEAELAAADPALAAKAGAVTQAEAARKAASDKIAGPDGKLVREWFASVPDLLWDTLDSVEAAKVMLEAVAAGTPPATVADDWEAAEDALVTALKARDAEAAEAASRVANLTRAELTDRDATALEVTRRRAISRFVLTA